MDLIQAACREFYTLEELQSAKETLWEIGDSSVLPPLKRRRDSPSRSEVDAVIADITEGLQKLDAANKIPNVAVDANGLHRMPRVRPAELCSVSLSEKVAKLEERLNDTQANLVNYALCTEVKNIDARLSDTEKRLSDFKMPSYAKAAEFGGCHEANLYLASSKTTSVPTPAEVETVYKQLDPGANSKVSKHQAETSKLPKNSSHNLSGAVNKNLSTSQMSITSAVSNASKPSQYAEGFEYPAAYKKNIRRKQNGSNTLMKKAVTGARDSSKLRGAPVPSRDLFIYRVAKDTDVNDLTEYMKEAGVDPRCVTKVSKSEAKFDSFKVEVKVTDMETALEEDFWPVGICARRFYKPKQNTEAEIHGAEF